MRRWITSVIGGILLIGTTQATDVNFSGILIQDACIIKPSDANQTVEFPSIVNRELYIKGRTVGKTLTITLEQCVLSEAQSVSMTLKGNADSTLPGFLALDLGSQAKGVAIGLETLQGVPVAFNQLIPFSLNAQTTVLQLKAFVQIYPEAMSSQNLTLGDFNATATLLLIYE